MRNLIPSRVRSVDLPIASESCCQMSVRLFLPHESDVTLVSCMKSLSTFARNNCLIAFGPSILESLLPQLEQHFSQLEYISTLTGISFPTTGYTTPSTGTPNSHFHENTEKRVFIYLLFPFSSHKNPLSASIPYRDSICRSQDTPSLPPIAKNTSKSTMGPNHIVTVYICTRQNRLKTASRGRVWEGRMSEPT